MVREVLRGNSSWVKFQEINREGWLNAFKRSRVQAQILKTVPVRTQRPGQATIEVRILTWRRGWLDALWALKSFYLRAQVDFPLVIHDGGLEFKQFGFLKEHFPDAVVFSRQEADLKIEAEMASRNLGKSLRYRRENVASLKLWDFFLHSKADFILSLDSDIVFFNKPEALLKPSAKNLFNKDLQFAYSMGLDELEESFGIKPPPFINSGLSLVNRESVRFDKIEEWLHNPALYADKWVTEQTLHALSSTIHGVELLPDYYVVGTTSGIPEGAICKHYPGFFRPLLYQEGMARLVREGFLIKAGAK